MAKTRSIKKNNFFKKHQQYLISSTIGGVIAWLASGDFGLGIIVFLAVWLGNKIAFSFNK